MLPTSQVPDQSGSIAEQLVLRTPHQAAIAALLSELDRYPRHLIERAAQVPVEIWLLDHGEAVSSVALLDPGLQAARWHGESVGLEDCAGLTVRLGARILIIAPWYRPVVLRHELGHALSVLLGWQQHRRIEASYADARRRGAFFVPLVEASVGEYVACGLAAFARPETRAHLAVLDPGLARALAALWEPQSEHGSRLTDLQRSVVSAAALLVERLRFAPSPTQ
jgi:hypothetical protein